VNRPRVDPLMLAFLILAIGFVALILWIVVRFSPAAPDPRLPTATAAIVLTVLPTPTPRPTLGPRTPTATPAERILTTPSRAPTETPPPAATAAPPETPRPAIQRG
jgi:outer membrane biosynthesis protein TonB